MFVLWKETNSNQNPFFFIYKSEILHTYVKREINDIFFMEVFRLSIEKVKKITWKERIWGVFWNYYSSTSTPTRDTTQVSFERWNSVQENQGELFQFGFWHFWRFWKF